jgi:hypothetical protein
MANRAWPLRALLLFVVLSVAAGLAAIPAQAEFTQQGNKLVGDDADNTPIVAAQGISVAVSADGNTAIVGGFGDNANAGAAWIYVRINGVWLQQGDKLVGTGAIGIATQGRSVALSADGNTAIVGGEGDDTSVGAAWVFTRDGNGVWTEQDKLIANNSVGQSHQGFSVGLSADGNTAIVGGYGDDSSAGAAWVYVRDGNGVWTQQDKLVGTGAAFGAARGTSVALSADGNTAVVGGNGDDSSIGAVWVFTRDGNGIWTQQGDKLVGTGAVGNAQQGRSVALSADGNTAVVGGHLDDSNAGAAWVFTRNGAGVWTQQGNKLVGNDAIGAATQAISVAVSGDGNTAVVGGQFDNGSIGAAWVFTRNGAGVWTQQGNKLVGTGVAGTPRQGFSVALSADGNTAVVGGLTDAPGGAAWVFGRPGITDISPNAGTVDGGTDVVIFGENFFDVTGVLFGGVAATNVTTVGANRVLATTPARAAGAVHVDVTTATGNSRLARGYTYQRHPTFAFLSSSLNPSKAGQRVTFTAYVSGGGAAASGKVIFKDGAQTLGTVNLRRGMARLSTTALSVGVHTIRAIFQRNGAFDASNAKLRHRVRN